MCLFNFHFLGHEHLFDQSNILEGVYALGSHTLLHVFENKSIWTKQQQLSLLVKC